MKRTPVGLVVANVKLERDPVPQWSLNIGGHVSPPTGEQDSSVMQVQGGLIVPLYVIILSVIGGAINMTRQVPRFQGEGEAQETRPKRRLNGHSHKALGASTRLAGLHTGEAPSQETREPRPSGHASLSDPHHSGRQDTDAQHVPWRIELLNQYMYLISAPFLAIATYYMLIWLDLTKVPVTVLVAFSVGLISEPILCAITDTAVRLLRQQPPPISPAVGAAPVTQPVTAEPALVK
jgi:hypothetical protein